MLFYRFSYTVRINSITIVGCILAFQFSIVVSNLHQLWLVKVFMETSALEALNVADAFTHVKKALDVGDDDSATRQSINVGSKGDVSESKKVGCCSS